MSALIELRLRDQAHQFNSEPGERLLYAGLRNRLDLPYECASGTCGTCKARLVSGEIEDLWTEAPGRRYLGGTRELLLCQSAARGDCCIEVRARSQIPVPTFSPVFGEGVVRRARPLAPDVLAFSVDMGRTIDFEAGQFVCLEFPQARGYRSYSIVNFEHGCSRLDFVVKQRAGGQLTPWLFRNEVDGSAVKWFGPLGRAIFRPDRPHDILCIAGGTGIAGILSILRSATESGHFAHSSANVFFGVRTQADAFYLGELDGLAAGAQGALRITVAFSEGDPDERALAEYPHLQFGSGFVHEVAKNAMAGRYQGVIAYLAGPQPAVDASMRMLLSARVPVQNMRFDKFT